MTDLKKVNYIVVHHTATSINTTFEQIKQMHLDKGWQDIGYHKVIDYNGVVHQGRKDSVIGAQAFGLNSQSLGIVCVGNFEEILPSDKQYKALVTVCATLLNRYKLPIDKLIGHKEVAKLINDPSSATVCPGKNLSLTKLRKDVSKYLDVKQV